MISVYRKEQESKIVEIQSVCDLFVRGPKVCISNVAAVNCYQHDTIGTNSTSESCRLLRSTSMLKVFVKRGKVSCRLEDTGIM